MWIDDEILESCHEAVVAKAWFPRQPLVVVGSANVIEREVDVEACRRDQVEILRRYGGGGAVVLHAGCLVAGVGLWVAQWYQNRHYFDLLNRMLIAGLGRINERWTGLSQNGLSDIVLGERKIAGTSLFRSRNYLLYQASVLIDPGLELIERYLRHPSREPEYRQGRQHSHFVTGLNSLAPVHASALDPAAVSAVLREEIGVHLRDELIGPIPEQFANLLARAGRSSQAAP